MFAHAGPQLEAHLLEEPLRPTIALGRTAAVALQRISERITRPQTIPTVRGHGKGGHNTEETHF